MNTIKISDVIIPSSFTNSKPREEKIFVVKEYVSKHGKLDKPIILDGNILTDNYIRYLVAIECGMSEVPYVTAQDYKEMFPQTNLPVTYVIGKFDGCRKEYTWKCKKHMPINIGDKVLVVTNDKKGNKKTAIVTVVKVFCSNSPKHLRHKPVIKRITMKE